MPIVIPRAAYARWLDPNERKPLDLLEPDASELAAHPVNPLVSNPRNDDARCIEAFED
jgi:putative SOS response-associated peptidase YedK